MLCQVWFPTLLFTNVMNLDNAFLFTEPGFLFENENNNSFPAHGCYEM